ncbi:MAG: NRDE family protein [Arenimonas sp.]
MCLIALAWKSHPRFELALIANRDEFHGRPSSPAARAEDDPAVFGGRDGMQGGGWLQVHAGRRLAAVTNVRVGLVGETAPRSRGALVHCLVREPAAAWPGLAAHAHEYGRFNLLAWNGAQLDYASNHPQWRREAVAPGLHSVSNADLDAPWPKASRARDALAQWLASGAANATTPWIEPLFAELARTQVAPDAQLPDTGIGIALERRLSASFIIGAEYGTRCTTVVLVERDAIHFHERRFGPDGAYAGLAQVVLARSR